MAAADRDWFEHEVLSALPELLGTARRLTRNSADAEDLVAETVAKAWMNRESLQDRSRVRGWLCTILGNTYISQYRARAVRPTEESFEEADPDTGHFALFERLHQPFLLWWGNPERAFLDKLLQEDLERAVDALPECFREVVVLVELQGLAYGEVAEALDVPIGTVRSRLARGRSLLQRALWDHAVDAGVVAPADTSTRRVRTQ